MNVIDYNEPGKLSDEEIVNAIFILRASRVWESTLRTTRRGEGDPLMLRFKYTNWKGDNHEYVILVESIEFGAYDKGGTTPRPASEWSWVVHGDVVTRDGDTRRNMGTRRRTFMLAELREIDWVAGS
jgi:hypothetical protein